MNVQISEGLRLSDENARVFARHMLADLKKYNDRLDGLIRKERMPSLGNAKGQGRFYERLIRLMGPTVLDASCYVGKKCNFEISISAYWVKDDRLIISLLRLRGRGKHDPCDVASHRLLEFSLHALQRLIQRSGVRASDDYREILRWLTVPALRLTVAMLEGGMQDGETWPFPVTINDQRILMLVRRDGEKKSAVVATVYKGTWRSSPELDALEGALLEESLDNTINTMPGMFRSAARAFR